MISFIFIVFAVLQWNDSDYYIWIPSYLLVSALAFQAARGKYYYYHSAAVSLLFLVWLCTYAPFVRGWIHDGLPSITGSMHAESLYIERVRESLGLLLCLATSVIYLIISKKQSL